MRGCLPQAKYLNEDFIASTMNYSNDLVIKTLVMENRLTR